MDGSEQLQPQAAVAVRPPGVRAMLVVAAIAAAATAFGFGLARAGSGGEPASGGFVPSGGGFLQLQEEPEAPDAQTPDAERDCPWKDGSGTDATGIEQV